MMMKELFKKISLRTSRSSKAKKNAGRKSKGQSLVEIAIAFPLIILLISGVVEFGFIINYYLSLMDSTREAARRFSNFDAFEDGSRLAVPDCTCVVSVCPNEAPEDTADADCDRNSFYSGASAMVISRLWGIDPAEALIEMNTATDDVIITVYTVDVDGAGVATITSFPESGAFQQYGNQTSSLTDSEVLAIMSSGGDPLVDTGILLVEVFWGYAEVFPTLDPILPDPVMLHAYTVMPLASAAPVDP